MVEIDVKITGLTRHSENLTFATKKPECIAIRKDTSSEYEVKFPDIKLTNNMTMLITVRC